MRCILLLTVAITLFGLAGGCSNDRPNDEPISETSDLQGRLEAAMAVTDIFGRNDALIKVAEDSAIQGDPNVVRTAIGEIRDPFAKNESAANAALKLAASGEVAGATEVAKMITDPARRNSVLSKLAKGEYSE